MTTLTVYIDFKSPNAYLAIQPTLALLDEDWAKAIGLNIRWRPFSVKAPGPPIAKKADESVGERHARVRDQYTRATQQKYAAVQGLSMHFPAGETSTDLALATLAGLADDADAFVTAAFEAYWAQGADLNDPSVLAELSADVPPVTDVPARLAQASEAAEADGVIDTPAYIVGEELFIGRAHLPWIRELLQGS